jgi:fatty acid desaturase
MDRNLFLLIAFSLLLTHEMDAVRRREWTIFPLLRRITGDERGYTWFTAIHIPLYIVLLWALFPGGVINRPVAIGFDIFCMIHVLLHWLLRNDPRYQFNNPFSWSLIVGAGIGGGLDLVLRV